MLNLRDLVRRARVPPAIHRWAAAASHSIGPAPKWFLGLLVAAPIAALPTVTLVTYTTIELARFARAEIRQSTLLYSGGQRLAPGLSLRAIDLASTLGRLRYRQSLGAPTVAGQFRHTGSDWEIYARGLAGPTPPRRGERLRLTTRNDRITGVWRDGKPVEAVELEPEVLTAVDVRPGEAVRPVRLAEVPLSLIEAVLAAEDHRFFEHAGVDVRGLLRAARANWRAGRITQGGSTLTQQLVKTRLLSPRRTLLRKLREAWLAAVIEVVYAKPRILEAYLNEIYLGQVGPLAIRGVGSAARAYFHREIHQLTLAESALLAGMIRAPNTYSPIVNAARARERRDLILARMHELGRITAQDVQAAQREPVRAYADPSSGQIAPYFVDYARQDVEARLGGDVEGGSGRVVTTLDRTLQRFAEGAVARGLDRLESAYPRLRRTQRPERLEVAVVVVEPATGAVRALVGGRDYQASQFNRALLARRQPGSAFKPFVYAAALTGRNGDRPSFTAATIVDDSPITLKVGNDSWTPRNYEDRYAGPVTVRRALELSLNAATVRVAQAVGVHAVVDEARALGLTSPLATVPAAALGAFEVTPVELAAAYLPFADAGRRPPGLSAVARAWDADGTELAPSDGESAQVMTAAEAYLMTSLLQGVIDEGTGAGARDLGVVGAVAGKTGTTNDGRDAWFVGYTPTLLALVWVGFDNGTPLRLSGAQAALPIWADFMKQAIDAYGAPPFPVPAGITTAVIDTTNGKLANRYCPLVARENFLAGTEPPPCDEHGGVADQLTDWWRRFTDWLGR
jgi:penicillin-binding protein 1B